MGSPSTDYSSNYSPNIDNSTQTTLKQGVNNEQLMGVFAMLAKMFEGGLGNSGNREIQDLRRENSQFRQDANDFISGKSNNRGNSQSLQDANSFIGNTRPTGQQNNNNYDLKGQTANLAGNKDYITTHTSDSSGEHTYVRPTAAKRVRDLAEDALDTIPNGKPGSKEKSSYRDRDSTTNNSVSRERPSHRNNDSHIDKIIAKERTKYDGFTDNAFSSLDKKQLASIVSQEQRLKKLGINVPEITGTDQKSQNQRLDNIKTGIDLHNKRYEEENDQSLKVLRNNLVLARMEVNPNGFNPNQARVTDEDISEYMKS